MNYWQSMAYDSWRTNSRPEYHETCDCADHMVLADPDGDGGEWIEPKTGRIMQTYICSECDQTEEYRWTGEIYVKP